MFPSLTDLRDARKNPPDSQRQENWHSTDVDEARWPSPYIKYATHTPRRTYGNPLVSAIFTFIHTHTYTLTFSIAVEKEAELAEPAKFIISRIRG